MNRGGPNQRQGGNMYRNNSVNRNQGGPNLQNQRGGQGQFNRQNQNHNNQNNRNNQLNRSNNQQNKNNAAGNKTNSNNIAIKPQPQTQSQSQTPVKPAPVQSQNQSSPMKAQETPNKEIKNDHASQPTPKSEVPKDVQMTPVTVPAPTKREDSQSQEKKFTGRCRLFVGNTTPDITEDEFRKLFEPYGEVSEVYVNPSRGFGFIRLDYRQNAEAAKAALDGMQRKGRVLRIRFATHGAALKVKNLHPYVSNELLEECFSQFGDIERCVVIVDDRGKSTGEGIVEFVKKPYANSALRRISDGVFLMGSDPKPIQVEPLEQKDEEDGMPEKFLTKTEQYKKEREKEPRFAPPGTFEYEFGMRWKQLEELEKQRIEQVKKDTEEARLKLEDEMQNALYDYQAEQIRQDLMRQQEELRRIEEMRNADRQRRMQDMERRRDQVDRQAEERRRADMMMNIRQQEIASRTTPMDSVEMRRREEMMMAERFGQERMMQAQQDRMNQGQDRMQSGMGDRMGPGMDRMGPGVMDRMGPSAMDRMGHGSSMDRMGQAAMERMGPGGMPDRMRERGPGGWPDEKPSSGGPKPLMAGMDRKESKPDDGPRNSPMDLSSLLDKYVKKCSGKDRKRGYEGGPRGGPGDYQNQRGVLGPAPSMGGPGGPGGSQQAMAAAASAAAAAAALNQMRASGPGMFPTPPQQQVINERMALERRREAAREELNDMKRMRRM